MAHCWISARSHSSVRSLDVAPGKGLFQFAGHRAHRRSDLPLGRHQPVEYPREPPGNRRGTLVSANHVEIMFDDWGPASGGTRNAREEKAPLFHRIPSSPQHPPLGRCLLIESYTWTKN